MLCLLISQNRKVIEMTNGNTDRNDYSIKKRTLTDGTYYVLNEKTGCECPHRHKTWEAADRCAEKQAARFNKDKGRS